MIIVISCKLSDLSKTIFCSLQIVMQAFVPTLKIIEHVICAQAGELVTCTQNRDFASFNAAAASDIVATSRTDFVLKLSYTCVFIFAVRGRQEKIIFLKYFNEVKKYVFIFTSTSSLLLLLLLNSRFYQKNEHNRTFQSRQF